MHPSVSEWQFLTTINVTTTTNTTMKKLKEETSTSKRVENQTNYKITDNRVGSGELAAMVKVTKITYILKLTGGRCTGDSFS